jgi:hypothetical protein
MAGLAIAATAGCSNFRENLGLDKNPPDEFRVVSREPLSMPPDFELRAPEPGSAQTTRRSAREQAEQTIFTGDDSGGSNGFAGPNGMSRGEQALLTQAGAQNVDPDIRQTIARETDRLEQAERNFVNSLIFWQQPAETAKVVDADKEAKRLRENTALGKGVTEGETPTIERKERGFLEGLFN